MLIRFVVENFISFKDEIVFEMLATSDSSHQSHVVTDEAKKVSILRTAALYGANASGKSNLVLAMDFARKLIVNGTRSKQSINVRPFRLDETTRQRPSKFEFTFKHKGVIYNYGFILNRQRILEEWLFATPNKQEVAFFERVTDTQGEVKVKFSASLAGKSKSSRQRLFLDFVAQGTRENQLFLTEAVERNVAKLAPVVEWLRDVLQIIRAESKYTAIEIETHKDKRFRDFLGNLLKSVGTGIECVSTEASALDFDKKFPEMPEDIKQKIKDTLNQNQAAIIATPEEGLLAVALENEQPTIFKLKMHHQTASGETERFDLEDESEGTQRLVHLAPILFNSKLKETVCVIDELDRRLHTHLSKAFIETFLSGDSKGQLIFTTHDTNLIDEKLFRKDEIWFVQKNERGESDLYSLAEFKPRKGLNLEKGYLNGRFGAIPFISEINRAESETENRLQAA